MNANLRSPTQKEADELKEIVVWCIERQGRCFKEWPAKKVFAFFAFHLMSGTLFVVRRDFQIKAVGVAWTGDAEEFRRRNEKGEPQFAWRLPTQGPDLMVSTVFGERGYIAPLWTLARERFHWITGFENVFTYRRDKMVEISLDTVLRFASKTAGAPITT